jgi:hypothetical protein
MRQEDPRLARTVSIFSASMSVGEVLAAVSALTGIRVVADAQTGAGYPRVFISVRAAPAADVMDGLWSLFSARGAEWAWDRRTEAGQFTYTLSRPEPARQLATRLRNRVQRAFEDEAGRMRAAAALPREQLAKTAGDDRRLRGLLKYPQDRAGLDIFFNAVPIDVQTRILRREIRHWEVPLALAPAASREQILKQASANKALRKLGNGPLEEVPPPTKVTFDVFRFCYGGVAPGLHMEVEGRGGGFHLGGTWLEEDLDKELNADWLLEGDSRVHPLETQPVPPTTTPLAPAASHNPTDMLIPSLREVSIAASVPVIARLPVNPAMSSSWRPPPPYDHPLGEWLKKLTGESFIPLFAKWRGNALLLTFPGWIYDDANQVPDPLIARLRMEAANSGGVIRLPSLIEAAAAFDEEHLRSMQPEFQAMGAVANWREVLNYLHDHPTALERIESPFGLPLTDEFREVVRSLKYRPGFTAALDDELPTALRLTVAETGLGHEITFGFVEVDGRFRPVEGFVQKRTVSASAQPNR